MCEISRLDSFNIWAKVSTKRRLIRFPILQYLLNSTITPSRWCGYMWSSMVFITPFLNHLYVGLFP